MRYQELASLQALSLSPTAKEPNGTSIIEIYARIRARIVLGKITSPQIQALRISGFPSVLLDLLDAQCLAYTRTQLPALFEKVAVLESKIRQLQVPPLALEGLLGEFFFTLGFISAQNSRFQRAINHQKLALVHYHRADLPAHAGFTLFNLTLNFRHLSEGTLATSTALEFETLCQSVSIPALDYALSRLRGYEELHRDEFQSALDHFHSAVDQAKTLGRNQDQAWLSIHILHCLICLNRQDEAQQLLQSINLQNKNDAFLSPLRGTFDAFSSLLELGMMTGAEAHTYFKKLENSGEIEPIGHLFLIAGALKLLARSHEWEALERLAAQAHRVSIRLEQSPGLVEFRGFQVQALMALNRRQEAEKVARAIESTARAQGAVKRLAELQHLLGETNTVESDLPTSILLDHTAAQMLIRKLRSGESRISFARNPSLLRLIRALKIAPRDGLTVDDFFSQVFEIPFHSEMHESRLASLISRARNQLGCEASILRSDRKIFLHPSIQVEERGNDTIRERNRRRNLLLKAMTRTPDVRIRIPALEEVTGIPRRTLQKDLLALARAKKIQRFGSARAVYYALNPSQTLAREES